MARAKLKTEMTGTGGGRWTTRADAKASSDGRRREADRSEASAGLEEWRTLPEFRVVACEPGIDPRAVSGWYVRAGDEAEARLRARRAGLRVTARARVHVERWKEPGQ
jgi:hypothetical protein